MSVGGPALWTAASLGRSEEVGRLLREGADIEEKGGYDNTTPLHEAVNRGAGMDTVRILLENDADVTTKGRNGETLLHTAAYPEKKGPGGLEVTRLLLKYGADVSGEDDCGETPLNFAIEAIPAVGPDETGWDEHSDVLQTVWLFLEHGANPAAKDGVGGTPLHNAAWFGDPELVRLLLANGTGYVSSKNNEGKTPLHFAAAQCEKDARVGHGEVALLFINAGDAVSAPDNDGNTPLHAAATCGHSEMARVLLGQGADHSLENADGQTPLDLSTERIDQNEGWPASVLEYTKVSALLQEAKEAVRRVKCAAFTLGHHARLGASSLVATLEPDVTQMILDRA
jgi:ankyrin repeat protein